MAYHAPKKTIDIAIPDNPGQNTSRPARVIVTTYDRHNASYERGFYTDDRDRMNNNIDFGNGRFEFVIRAVRDAIYNVGRNQGWLDVNAQVILPHDRKSDPGECLC